ncbi:MAG TPA: ectonucleotide pyrophosphatase/phosphodiesterase [Thermoanaerobaculia bacterium]|nr:ectonucleotide pyrophosphatase/phosphodiesterase [Thermoanaerobaculia bacterium]
MPFIARSGADRGWAPMRRAAGVVLLLLALLAVAAGCRGLHPPPRAAAPAPSATVLLVSIDGFRWDYLDLYQPPTLQRLAREGVRAERLIPSFPTKTFPNHYTLVTGLYPAHHGVIANNMYDPLLDARFAMSDRGAVGDGRWWGGVPLWVTAERRGLPTAPMFWPGSEAAIQGVRPRYWQPFDHHMPGAARVEQVLAWLDLPPGERPAFLTLYFSDVDSAGHDFDPVSPQVAAAVGEVDRHLGALVAGLEARGIYDEVDLVVVSDHGMSDTSAERVVVLDEWIDLDDVRIVDLNPVAMLAPLEGRGERVYDALRRAPGLTVYRQGEVPPELHFSGHRRIPEILALAEDGWSIATRSGLEARPHRFDGGNHGYDPRLPSMHALFVARGPHFVAGAVVPPFESVHVYELMAAILGLEPAPNDGDLGVVRQLLSSVEQVAPDRAAP